MDAININHQIDKSDLLNMSFAKEDTLVCKKEKLERNKRLRKSLILGNIHKHHVNIYFKDQSGRMLMTIATVWAVTDHYVTLKGGVHIPIKSIISVNLC